MKIMFKEYVELLLSYETVVVMVKEQSDINQIVFKNTQNNQSALLDFYNNHSDYEISSIYLNPWDSMAEVNLKKEADSPAN